MRILLCQCHEDVDEDEDEAAVWTAEDFALATHRVGLKPSPLKKQKINITLDPDVVAWFKMQTGGRGYQTLINATLRYARQCSARPSRKRCGG